MTPTDILHARARELAEKIADRIALLEPERALVPDALRLAWLLFRLGLKGEQK